MRQDDDIYDNWNEGRVNFHYFPELDEVWAYPAFWALCLISAGIMLLLFRRRNWL